MEQDPSAALDASYGGNRFHGLHLRSSEARLQFGGALGNTSEAERGVCLVVTGTFVGWFPVTYWNDGTIRFRITTNNPRPISKRLTVPGSGA